MKSGKLVRYLTVLAGMVMSMPAIAAEHVAAAPERASQTCTLSTHSIRQLAMIDHTSDGGFQCIGVYVEGDKVRAIRLERHVFSGPVGQQEPEQVKVVEFPMTTLDSLRGAVIDGIPGHDAIVLRGHLSAEPTKRELEISYLYNGLTGEYHRCQIELDRTPSTGWRLVNRLDQTISLIMVKLRQIPVIGTVGILNLEGACI